MRKILSLVLLLTLVYLNTSAQQVNPIGGLQTQNWVKYQMKVDSGFRLPLDTLISALQFSEAYKNGTKYYKGSDGYWHQVIASVTGNPYGTVGNAIIGVSGSTISYPFVRDSTGRGVHHIVNGDNSWTLYGDSIPVHILPPLFFVAPGDTVLGVDTLHHNYNAGFILGLPISGTPGNGQTLIFNSTAQTWGFGAGGGGSSLPLVDNQILFQNSTTATKQAGLNLSYIPASTTVYDSLPANSTLLAGTSSVNTWYVQQNHAATIAPTTNGLIDLGIGGTNDWKTVHARNLQSSATATVSAATADSIKLQINGVNQVVLYPSGQLQLNSYTGGAFGSTAVNGLGVDASGNMVTTPNTSSASNVFTSTLTNTTNLTSSALLFASYLTTGNIVEVTVSGTFVPTTASSVITLTSSVPTTMGTSVSTPVGSGTILSGSAYLAGLVTTASSTTVVFQCVPSSTGTNIFAFKYSYSQSAIGTMSTSPGTLTLTSTAGTQGGSQSTTLTWANLGSNAITIPAPTGYVVSLNNTTWASSQTISSPGASGSQTIYYALASSNSAGPVNATSTIACTALSLTAPVALNGTVSAAASLSVSPSTLTLTSITGTQGGAQSTTITGSGLGSNLVTIPAPPTGYVDSIAGSTWLTTSRTITPSSGNVSQIVYYALASGNAAATYNTTTTITDAGAGVSGAVLTLNGTTSTSGSTVYAFDFSLTSHAAPSGFTNVFGNPTTSVLTGTSNGVTISTVATANWSGYSGAGSDDTYGMTGSTISYFPDSVLYRSLFTYSGSTHLSDSATMGLSKPQFTASGLTPGQSYTLKVASSASSAYGFTCNNVLRAEGNPTYGVLISNNIGDVRNNTTQYYLITGIIASASGTINIYTNTTSGQQIFWTNGITLQ